MKCMVGAYGFHGCMTELIPAAKKGMLPALVGWTVQRRDADRNTRRVRVWLGSPMEKRGCGVAGGPAR